MIPIQKLTGRERDGSFFVELNHAWNASMEVIQEKPKSAPKVQFAPDLVKIGLALTYDRKNIWIRYTLDRFRFERRIKSMEDVLSPCLQPEHRLKIYRERFLRTRCHASPIETSSCR